MKAYIYQIINKITGERYIGQTINLQERKNKHFQSLKNNKHPNFKLQNAWNNYGEDNFDFVYEEFDVRDKEELNCLEIEYITKFNSYYTGYNLTRGGDGGDTKSKLNYEQYCLIYLGCQWKGMTVEIGKYFNVDSACISAILREKSYLFFKEDADKESEERKEYYKSEFRRIFGIPNSKKPDDSRVPTHLTEDEYFYCLCVASSYSRGIEQALANFFGKHKSFLSNGMKSAKTQGKAYRAKQRFMNLSVDEIKKIGEEKFNEWDITEYANSSLHKDFNGKWRQ